MQARAGAMMEAIEHYCCERPPHEFALASHRALRRRATAVDPRSLVLDPRAGYADTLPLRVAPWDRPAIWRASLGARVRGVEAASWRSRSAGLSREYQWAGLREHHRRGRLSRPGRGDRAGCVDAGDSPRNAGSARPCHRECGQNSGDLSGVRSGECNSRRAPVPDHRSSHASRRAVPARVEVRASGHPSGDPGNHERHRGAGVCGRRLGTVWRRTSAFSHWLWCASGRARCGDEGPYRAGSEPVDRSFRACAKTSTRSPGWMARSTGRRRACGSRMAR